MGLFGRSKFLGMQDISIGYREFDEEFIIKSNNEGRISQLFSNEKIRFRTVQYLTASNSAKESRYS